MKTKILHAAVMLIAGTCASSFGQTNVFSAVMVNTNGSVYRPTNFWSANANAIPTNFWTANANAIANAVSSVSTNEADVKLDHLFAKTRFTTTFANVSTSLSNVSVGNEPAWFSMFSLSTNASAQGEAMLMRNVLAGESTGAGLLFGTQNYKLVVDMAAATGSTNNVVRFVIGNTFTDADPLTGTGFGVEVRENNGTNQIRAIARNGTNAQVQSGWIDVGGPNRMVVSLESRTGGQVLLSTAQGVSGVVPTLRTNISGGPTQGINAGNSHLNVGLFINSTNAGTRYVSVYGAGVQIVD